MGNNVSHAHNKTKRRWNPNLCNVTLMSEMLDRQFKFKVAAKALRSIDHAGGLDAFLLKAKERDLGPKAVQVRKELIKAQKEAA